MGDQDRVRRYRGCLALQFAANSSVKNEIRSMLGLDLANQQQLRFAMLPEVEWHVTLVTKEELRGLSAGAVQEAMELLSTRCFAIGLGGGDGATSDLNTNGVYFVVCVWPKTQAFRTKHGLPLKDFHVSVSTTNRHDLDKSSGALLSDACLKLLDKSALEAPSRQGANLSARWRLPHCCVPDLAKDLHEVGCGLLMQRYSQVEQSLPCSATHT